MQNGLQRVLIIIVFLLLWPFWKKRANLMLQNQDAYLKATGGVRLDEPAIDLAMAVAIASSYRNQEIASTDCFIGENWFNRGNSPC